MNIAIYEPDTVVCRSLATMLQRYCTAHAIPCSLFCCSSPISLLQSSRQFHIFLLAHQRTSPGNGAEIVRQLQAKQPNVPPEVVFLLSSPNDALLCLETTAAGYLLKPVAFHQLSRILDQCMTRLHPSGQTIEICSSRIPVKLPVLSILYAEVRKNLTFLHTVRQTYQTYLSLEQLACRLPAEDFLRCHRSYLVHLRYVSAVEGNSFVLENGVHVPLRVRETAALRRSYQAYCFHQLQSTIWQTNPEDAEHPTAYSKDGAPTSRPKSQV